MIEDNCDALGSRYRGRLTGTFGHLATMSFYPAHHITMGEGGCVVTNDEQLARIARSFRDWGRDCYCAGGENNTCGTRFSQQFGTLPHGFDHKYVYSHIGYNLKVTDMQAAIGCAQLGKLDGFIARRRANFDRLMDVAAAVRRPAAAARRRRRTRSRRGSGSSSPCARTPASRRADLVGFLEANRVETRSLFAGNLLRHPAFQGIPHRIVRDLANTDTVMNNTFFVGVYPGLDAARLDHMAAVFDRFMSGERVAGGVA